MYETGEWDLVLGLQFVTSVSEKTNKCMNGSNCTLIRSLHTGREKSIMKGP